MYKVLIKDGEMVANAQHFSDPPPSINVVYKDDDIVKLSNRLVMLNKELIRTQKEMREDKTEEINSEIADITKQIRALKENKTS